MHPESACQGDAAKPTRGASVRGCQRPDRKAVDLKGSRPVIRKISNVQIELSGRCSAECEFCDWVRRPKEQMIFMDTEVAKKCVREARTLGARVRPGVSGRERLRVPGPKRAAQGGEDQEREAGHVPPTRRAAQVARRDSLTPTIARR